MKRTRTTKFITLALIITIMTSALVSIASASTGTGGIKFIDPDAEHTVIVENVYIDENGQETKTPTRIVIEGVKWNDLVTINAGKHPSHPAHPKHGFKHWDIPNTITAFATDRADFIQRHKDAGFRMPDGNVIITAVWEDPPKPKEPVQQSS